MCRFVSSWPVCKQDIFTTPPPLIILDSDVSPRRETVSHTHAATLLKPRSMKMKTIATQTWSRHDEGYSQAAVLWLVSFSATLWIWIGFFQLTRNREMRAANGRFTSNLLPEKWKTKSAPSFRVMKWNCASRQPARIKTRRRIDAEGTEGRYE